MRGRACSTHGRGEIETIFRLGKLEGRDHSEDIGVDEKILERMLGN